tara:strand:- start:1296 stop:1505 length:210 start_codon:yes stop_codon:yes gene_type:complete
MLNPLKSELRKVSKSLSVSLFSYFLRKSYFVGPSLKKRKRKKEFFIRLLVYLNTFFLSFSGKIYALSAS